MFLNQATDYGFRIVLMLSRQEEGGRLEASEISRTQVIPERFLFKIMRSLIKAGLVKSFRGVKGGFALARKPDEITMLDVVEAVEGPVLINSCLSDGEACNRDATGYCVIHLELGELRQVIVDKLKSVRFQDILVREQNFNKGGVCQ